MNKIRKNLYIGNASDSKKIKELDKAHITAILNVAYEVDDPIYFPDQFNCIKIGLSDSNKNTIKMRQLAIDTLVKLLEHGDSVLVHCGAGQSRAVFVASHGIAKFEKSQPEVVLEEIIKIRPFAHKGPLWESFGYKPIGAE